MIVLEQLVIIIFFVNMDIQKCNFRNQDPDLRLVIHRSEVLQRHFWDKVTGFHLVNELSKVHGNVE